ncbi:MAG: hypothetical protein U0M15_07600 [Bacillota bacterium]|nr:hypothetical protein [Bacillota bacterium]
MTAADKPWNQPIVEEEIQEGIAEFFNPPGFDGEETQTSYACVLSKPYWGENDDQGVDLLVAYLEALGRKMQRPAYVVLVHNAVNLAVEGHKAFEALRRLGDTGTSILLLQGSVASDDAVDAGTLASMDEIVAVMAKVDQTISI